MIRVSAAVEARKPAPQPRPYQADLIARAAGTDNLVIHAPTGAGKTVIQAILAEQEAARGGYVLALSHRRNLQESLAEAVGGHGVSLTVQSAVNRLDRLQQPTLILTDETHHAVAPIYRRVYEAFPEARRLGFTATTVPGLSGLYDRMIAGPTVAELTAQGFLAPADYLGLSLRPDLAGVRVRGGDYEAGALLDALSRSSIHGDAIAAYREHASGRPALVFCVSIQHAVETAKAWNAAGIKSAVITGQTPGDERRKLIRRHRERDIQAIVSVGVLFEGTDMPWAEVAVVLRPTLSRVVHLQSLGRVLRTNPGKERALVIDCPGNTMRLGTAAAPRTWTLDGLAEDAAPGKTKTKDGELLSIRQCPSCLAIHEAGGNSCPSCGEIWLRERRVSADTTAELERLAEEEIARRQKVLARERQREEAEAKTLADLIALGRRRRYAPGWAHARWKARQSRSTKS